MCISLFWAVQEEDFLVGDIEVVTSDILCFLEVIKASSLWQEVLGSGFWLGPGMEELAAELSSSRRGLWRGQRMLLNGLRFVYWIESIHLGRDR